MTWLTNPFRFGGSGPPVTPTDRWRAVILSADWPSCSLAEVEMAGSPGGADLCVGGSGTMINGTGSAAALFANDGGTTFAAALNGYNDSWTIGYTFPSPVTIAEIRLQARGGGSEVEAPKALVTQISTDGGTTWRSVSLLWNEANWTALETRAFATGGTIMTTGLGRSNARGWRMAISSSNGSATVMVGEVVFAATPGGAAITSGGVAISNINSTFSDRPPRAAFDANSSTRYQGGGGSFPTWNIGYAKQTPMGDATQLRVTNVSAAEAAEAPSAWVVQYSEDLVDWTTVATISGQTGWGTNETRSFSI